MPRRRPCAKPWRRTFRSSASAVIVNDSVGRAWRLGTVGLAIGVAGMTALCDLRGDRDLFGRELLVSETGIADQVASAAQIVQGEGDEGTPVVRVRGLERLGPAQTARDLLRPRHQDLFR